MYNGSAVILLDYTGPLFPPFVSPLFGTNDELLLAAALSAAEKGKKGALKEKQARRVMNSLGANRIWIDWIFTVFISARCSTIGGTSSVRPHEPFVRLARSISRSVRSASRNGIGLGKKIGLLNSDGIVLHTM